MFSIGASVWPLGIDWGPFGSPRWLQAPLLVPVVSKNLIFWPSLCPKTWFSIHHASSFIIISHHHSSSPSLTHHHHQCIISWIGHGARNEVSWPNRAGELGVGSVGSLQWTKKFPPRIGGRSPRREKPLSEKNRGVPRARWLLLLNVIVSYIYIYIYYCWAPPTSLPSFTHHKT